MTASSSDIGPCAHVAFTGHRPHRISWWAGLWLPGRLERLLKQFETEGTVPTLYCGLAAGADLIAVRIALKRGWRVVAILPAKELPYRGRPLQGKWYKRFKHAMKTASEIHVANTDQMVSDPYRAAAVMMLGFAECLIAVHDGGVAEGPGGTHDVMSIARQRGMKVHELRLWPARHRL